MPLYLTMIVLFWTYAILSISSCSNIERNESHKDVSLESIEKGKELAEKYCQSCHLLPTIIIKITKHGVTHQATIYQWLCK